MLEEGLNEKGWEMVNDQEKDNRCHRYFFTKLRLSALEADVPYQDIKHRLSIFAFEYPN